MPVLLVGNFLSASGGSRGVCEELALRLSALGWPVVKTSDKRPPIQRLADMLSTAWKRRHEYSVAQVDIYSGRAFFWAEAVCAILRLAGKPFILTLHGGNLPAFARQHRRRIHRLLGAAAAVTAPSNYLYEQMRPYRPDLQVLPNALELKLYPFRAREKLRPHLIWLRAFHEQYNPCLGPEVLALLGQERPAARLTMVGPDKGDGSLQRTWQRAAALDVQERLQLAGGVGKAEVPAWLDRGDLFLNTTDVDNAPVSVLEAMACGLCVISTDAGGLRYLLKHGQDALLVPPNDAQAMAAAVRRVLQEPALATRLSHNARAKAEEHDWSVVLPQWERLFCSALPRTALV